MKKTLLTYNDIHSLSEYRFANNGTVVDEKTVAVIKEIEKSLARLEAMGDDNVRCLWFRVAPGKPEDWGDYEDMKSWGDVENYDEYIALWKEHVNENTLWYRISVGYVKDFRYSKGLEAFEFDLDSEADFEKWHDENCAYHCFDVVYARVNLWAEKNAVAGKWHFEIHTSSYWNLDDYLTITEKLHDAGMTFKYGNKEKILPILKETDLVEITPGAYRYFQGDGIGSQIALWNIPDNVFDKVIAATTWKKQPEVKPIKV